MVVVADEDASPQDFDSLRALILARHGTLPKRLAQVARFAVENPEEVAFGTAASIAKAAHVQPSTLVRLGQSLGYQGFTDLQAVFRQRLKVQNSSYEERLAHAKSMIPDNTSATHVLAVGILEAAVQSIEQALPKLDPEALEAATTVLAEADTIYLLAQRRSFPVASYLAYIFGKLKMRACIVGSAQGGEETVLELARPQDAAIAISFTPYASATVDWVQILANRDVPVVGITDSVFSPVARLSKVWLEIAESDFEGFRSLGATMALSVALAVAAANKRRGH
ncbi:MurR/RpiR family transcriptional regulator [Consotaella salsifontis]|uniref:Transcriptional regulator, RpiR family n=1 Tax=Consotaella salsifontis TaxID=1365950 RepID=A0A1T4RLW5_9HYPH|nr:MurR/RpiR family transcriptional regulator [Consotaella salsifontis]SKA16933.1 transcriptional regulator, RpiR family [Consotaella salsifontis]